MRAAADVFVEGEPSCRDNTVSLGLEPDLDDDGPPRFWGTGWSEIKATNGYVVAPNLCDAIRVQAGEREIRLGDGLTTYFDMHHDNEYHQPTL